MNISTQAISLVIETAIDGGSISIQQNFQEIDNWRSVENSISRSEVILSEIDRILKTNNIQKKQLGKIILSRGPGSFTGIRIGLSIALGLSKAIGCKIYGISVFEAICADLDLRDERVGIYVPMNSKLFCTQSFKSDRNGIISKLNEPILISRELLKEQINNQNDTKLVLYINNTQQILTEVPFQKAESIFKFDKNPASILGSKRTEKNLSPNISPIYLINQ